MTTGELLTQGRAVKAAAAVLAQASDESRQAVLRFVAERLESSLDELLGVNEVDVANYHESGPGRDRLALTPERIHAMANALREVAASADPLFERVDVDVRPNGLRVERVRVPLGVIGVVYENRPNVTSDVAGLCLRSGNAAFLRGSSSALRTNQFIVSLWHEALEKESLPKEAVSLVEETSHETVVSFMQLTEVLDCLIPRGGPSLIRAMREHARVPYVLDGDGNCHVYVDDEADVAMAVAIVKNAKTSRPGVCNAAETLLVHANIAPALLGELDGELSDVEPFVAPGLAGGVFYEQDCQVQPMLAVASRVAELRGLGVRLVWPAEVTGAQHDADGRIVAAETDRGRVSIGTCVVNAGGPWSGTVAARLGAIIPVVPRRGHVLVTEPVAPVTLHKVAEAGYVGSVHAGGDGRSCSAVFESTRSGTMLLGSSREFAGFSRRVDQAVVAQIAARAAGLFPGLRAVRLLRAYVGFRPATPDRMPIIGPDGAVPGLVHATGHEGAGIGLSEATGELVAALVLGHATHVDPVPFAATRFAPGQ
ncbi:MAG: glutamate-5-semialdehyde dehydrogenase [Actinobacteria bacterium 21-64-8]|nr:MAG: glutamate-5-semialdehyde dehydrogenase [Actinobacteria bacterium 21-64-8]